VADKALSVSLSHSEVLVLLEKLSYIEDRAQTDRVIIVADPNHRPMILTLNPGRAMVVTHTDAKLTSKGQAAQKPA